jgi:hypothetical protein
MVLRGHWVRFFPGDGTERPGLALDDATPGALLRVGWINFKPGDAALANLTALRNVVSVSSASFGGAGTVPAPYWLEA